MVKLSIVILNLNGLDKLKDCVKSIKENTKDYEIIVVDNGSTEGGTVKFIKENAHKYVLVNENTGYSAGNNIGSKLAIGEFICFLNNDTIVTDGWADEMIKTLNENIYCAMVGPLGNVKSSVIDNTVYLYQQYVGQYKKDTQVDYLSGYCILMKREIFNHILFDERLFLYFSDNLLCDRIRQVGYHCVVCCNALVKHEHPSTTLRGSEEIEIHMKNDEKKYKELFK